jgi:simple sugar transport system permease protein
MSMSSAAITRSAAPRRRGLATWYGDQRGRGALEVGVLFVLLQGFLVVWYLVDSSGFNYLSAGNLGVITQSGSWLAMLAIGSGIVMMVGEIDLSVGANMGMTSLVFLTWYQGGNAPIVCVLVAILTGVLIGVANALVLNFTKIPSLISTLGMMSLLWGLSVWYTGGDDMEAPRVAEFGSTFESVLVGDMFRGVHAQFAWVIVIGAIMWVVIHRHRLGNHIAAVGGNEQAAKAISVNPNRVRIYAFALLGLMCAVGGIMVSVQTKTGDHRRRHRRHGRQGRQGQCPRHDPGNIHPQGISGDRAAVVGVPGVLPAGVHRRDVDRLRDVEPVLREQGDMR